MDRDYQDSSQVFSLILNLNRKDITDWNGIGLILWDVYDILTRRMMTLTDTELLIVQLLGDGVPVEEILNILKIESSGLLMEIIRSIINKFIQFDREGGFYE